MIIYRPIGTPLYSTARHFDDGRSQYFRSDVNPYEGPEVGEMSLGCWFRKFSIPSGVQTFLYYGNAASNTDYLSFSLLNTSGFLEIFNRAGAVTFTSSTNLCDGSWHSIQVEHYIDSGSIQRWGVYLDAPRVNADPDSQSKLFQNLHTRISFGALDRLSIAQHYTGDVAHAWMAKVRCLGKTLSIHNGRSLFDLFNYGDLIGYWPLWGIHTPEPNLVNGGLRALEFNGPASTAMVGPNVQPFRRPLRVSPVAAGGLSIPVAMHHYTKNIGAA